MDISKHFNGGPGAGHVAKLPTIQRPTRQQRRALEREALKAELHAQAMKARLMKDRAKRKARGPALLPLPPFVDGTMTLPPGLYGVDQPITEEGVQIDPDITSYVKELKANAR